MSDDSPLSLQDIIKALSTAGSLPMRKSMDAARTLFPTRPTADSLSKLTDKQLQTLGVADKDARKAIRTAWPKVAKGKGNANDTKPKPPPSPAKRKRPAAPDMFEIQDPETESSSSSTGVDLSIAQLDFGHHLQLDKLMKAQVTVNRAPVMTAWATVVCLRLNFSLEEALSLASVYTDMNATAKAISTGLKKAPVGPTLEDELRRPGNTLPYLDLMGRRLPLVSRPDDTWRGISPTGEVCPPTKAARYLQSSLGSNVAIVLRTLTLLAASHPADYLQSVQGGFGLYMLIRPDPPAPQAVAEEVKDGIKGRAKGKGGEMAWGGKGTVKMVEWLALRGVEERPAGPEDNEDEPVEVKKEKEDDDDDGEYADVDKKPTKRPRLRRGTSSAKDVKIDYTEEGLLSPGKASSAVRDGLKLEVKSEETKAKVASDDEDDMWGGIADDELPDGY